MPCIIGRDRVCDFCGSETEMRVCPSNYKGLPAGACAVGSGIKRLLALVGIHSTDQCNCTSYAAKIDAWTCEEALERLDEIVSTMEVNARSLGITFSPAAARLLVRLAIRNARRNRSLAGIETR